jgi:hypothetical protein
VLSTLVSIKDLSEACDIKHHYLASKLRHGKGQSGNIYRTAQNQIVIVVAAATLRGLSMLPRPSPTHRLGRPHTSEH